MSGRKARIENVMASGKGATWASSGGGEICIGEFGGYSTVFGLNVGLRRFVGTLPTSGKVGEGVEILGTGLRGATFTVNSAGTAIKTVAASGATTGKVEVTRPGGTLSSNVPFRVVP
jgi:hypothetical protein